MRLSVTVFAPPPFPELQVRVAAALCFLREPTAGMAPFPSDRATTSPPDPPPLQVCALRVRRDGRCRRRKASLHFWSAPLALNVPGKRRAPLPALSTGAALVTCRGEEEKAPGAAPCPFLRVGGGRLSRTGSTSGRILENRRNPPHFARFREMLFLGLLKDRT